jgi:hypothetical protein
MSDDDDLTPGIGHNAGPPLVEPDKGAEVDPFAGPDLYAGAAIKQQSPEKEKVGPFLHAGFNAGFNWRHGQSLAPKGAGAAEAQHIFQPTKNIGAAEDFRAEGYYKIAGRSLMADGLVSRAGYRRIPPGWLMEGIDDHEEWAGNAELLANVAKQVLRNRNATVFEGLVLNPLLGRPGRTVEELAEQFGVPPARIYRIKDKVKQQMTAAIERHKAGIPLDSGHRESKYHAPAAVWVESEDRLPLGALWNRRGKYSDSFYDDTGRLYRVRRKQSP